MFPISYYWDGFCYTKTCPKRILSTLLILSTFVVSIGYAQEKSGNLIAQHGLAISPEGLQVGDKIPDILIKDIINYPGGTARVSDFKDQLLIIEFGNTRCSPCIASQEKLASLEREFDGAFKLLAVSYEPTETVQKLVNKREWSFAFATQDTMLKKLFPYLAVPHLVWIKNNRLLAITDAYEATKENILQITKGENVEFTLKQDRKYNPGERFTDMDPEGETTLFYSHLSGYQRGIGTSYAHRKLDNGNVKFSWVNHDAIMLLLEAFKGKMPYYLKYHNRLRTAVSDSLMRKLSMMYKLPATDGSAQQKWITTHGISYEIEVPHASEGNVDRLMQQELKVFFRAYYGIEVTVEKRKVPCLALLKTSKEDLLRSDGGKPRRTVKEDCYEINNMPLDWFFDSLLRIHRYNPLPIVNKTNYQGHVDLSLPGGLSDIPLLNRRLKKYGLVLREKTLEIDMIIIRQIDNEGNPTVFEERSPLTDYGIRS